MIKYAKNLGGMASSLVTPLCAERRAPQQHVLIWNRYWVLKEWKKN